MAERDKQDNKPAQRIVEPSPGDSTAKEQDPERDENGIRNSLIYEALFQDKDNVRTERILLEETVTVVGYLAQPSSTETGTWYRLYRTLDFREYIEFPYADIMHIEQLDTPQNPLGVTVVWLRLTARVRRTSPEPAILQGDFLRGDIAENYLLLASRGLRDTLRNRGLLDAQSPGCGSLTGPQCPHVPNP